MSLVDQLALLDARNLRHAEPGRLAVEQPDQAPRLRARKGGDPRPRRNPVAGRDVDAAPAGVEPPVVIGAADLPADDLSDREIGAEVGTVRALDDDPAARVPVRDDPRAQDVAADDLSGPD